jgi:hypothetical protein
VVLTRSLAWFLALTLLPALPALGEMLNGAQIRELFTGNTITGTYVTGGPFSEYHAVDGRALGDNGLALNVDACWNTDGDRFTRVNCFGKSSHLR